MAAKERVLMNYHPQKKRLCQEEDYLDVELLCAKLEIAKREREDREAASRLRKQVRESVRNDSYASRARDRPRLAKCASENDSGRRRSWYKLPGVFGQSFSTVNVNLPEHEPIESLDLISPVLDSEDRDVVLHSRGSPPDEDAAHRRPQMKTKRSSFTVLKNFTSGDREKLRHIGPTNEERPGSKQRSQTVPSFKSKFMLSRSQLTTTTTNTNEPRDSCRPSDEDESLGGFVNEYTISFDTCQVKDSIRHQAIGITQPRPPPAERPKWAQNEGMRSFLNLSSMLKKDKKDRSQTLVEEIRDPLMDDDEDDPMTRRPHTRSQTAPEGLIADSMRRMEKEKVKKAKKRRSVGGLLQALLLPNHSMSMHQVAI